MQTQEKEKITIERLINWCNQKASEGELALHWEGGGDSGWCYMTVNGGQNEEPEAEKIVQMMYDQLDYGSWAGEFSANGTAEYDPKTNTFSGTDFFTSSESGTYKDVATNITVVIPKETEFDTFDLTIDIRKGDSWDVTLNLFKKDSSTRYTENRSLCDQLSSEVSEQLETILDKEEFDTIYESFYEDKEDLKTNRNGDYVYTIENVNTNTELQEDKPVEINLWEMLMDEADDVV